MGPQTNQVTVFSSILAEIKDMLERKRVDYGPIDKTIGRFGMKGIVVRLTDKMERLINMTWGTQEPNFESVEDTLKDIAGYAVLGLQLKREAWCGFEVKSSKMVRVNADGTFEAREIPE